jgi:hypothetical protein
VKHASGDYVQVRSPAGTTRRDRLRRLPVEYGFCLHVGASATRPLAQVRLATGKRVLARVPARFTPSAGELVLLRPDPTVTGKVRYRIVAPRDTGRRPEAAHDREASAREAVLPASQRRFVDRFIEELRRRDPDGSRLERVDDASALARETAAKAVDTAAIWEQHLGALYDVEGVRALLGHDGRPISRQAVSKRKSLLALETGSGRVVYPSFQFVDRAPVPGIDKVLMKLPERLVSRWTVASWFVSRQRELGGETPIAALRRGEVERVTAAAERWAQSLAA